MAKRPLRPRSSDATEALRRLQGVFASAMDGIIAIDQGHRIVLFNPAAERMFGVSSDEALGQSVSRFIPEQRRAAHEAHIRKFVETGETNRLMGSPSEVHRMRVVSGLRASGEEFPIEASVSQVAAGDAYMAAVFLRDVTEQRAAEEAGRLLAAELDHRAKNVLAVVQAVVSLTQASTKDDFIAAVRGRISALARAHSLLAQGGWRGADLAQVIAQETEPYQGPGRISVAGPPVFLAAHAVQPVSLILRELATNAVKYGALSVEGGRVDIRVSILAGRELELRWTETGGPRVQEPAALGFGSRLLTEVVRRQLGGSLEIRWPADGFAMIATVPAAARPLDAPVVDAEADAERTTPERREAASGRRVLVVEDEALIAMDICKELAMLGWEIVGPAATIEDAERLLEGSPVPDAAILDVNLAGIAVYPLAERLRSQGVPVVFCTGYEQLDRLERYSDCAVIRKPVNIGLLADQLRTFERAAS